MPGTTPQTITFAPIPDVQGPRYTLTPGASSDSGLQVALAVTSGPAIWYDYGLTPTGPGTVTVTASQPGDDTYAAATPVSRTFNVAAVPELGPHDLTSYASHPPFVVSASSELDASSQAWRAFDGIWGADAPTAWVRSGDGQSAGQEWLQIDLGAQVAVSWYGITVAGTAPPGEQPPADSAPRAWTMQGSNDGASWTVLDTEYDIFWPCGWTQVYPLPTTSWRYFRLSVTSTHGGSGVAVAIAQLFLYTAATQTITFPAIFHPDAADTDAPFTLGAASDSGLPLTYTATGPAAVFWVIDTPGSGPIVYRWVCRVTGIGTVAVTASQPGNATYASAAPVTQTFPVTSWTVTAPSAPEDDLSQAWFVVYEPAAGDVPAAQMDRSAYLSFADGVSHTFTLQLRQRGQASIPLVIRANDPYMPTLGTLVKLYDRAQPVADTRTFVSATLKVLSSYVPGSYDSYATFTLGVVGVFGDAPWIHDQGSWTKRTDSLVLDVPSLAALQAGTLRQQFWLDGTIFGDGDPPDKLLVYDVWIEYVFDDGTTGTIRGTKATIYQGSTPATDGVLDPATAIDAFADTYATVQRSHFSGAGSSWILQVAKFLPAARDVTGAPVFVGTIDSIECAWLGDAGDRLVTLNAVSLEQVFDTILVPPRLFTNELAGGIFQQLYALADGSPVQSGFSGAIGDGVVIPSLLSNYDRISDLFDKLATASQFVWGVDPATMSVYFRAPSIVPAPWVVTCDEGLWESWNWKENRQDFRDWQGIRLSPDAFAHSKELFAANGSSSYTLLRAPQQITNVWQTKNTQNSATGTFTANPAVGDTVTIAFPGAGAGSQYNWAATSPYVTGQIVIDPAGHIQKCTLDGTSGATEPVWHDDGGPTGPDGSLYWQDEGVSGAGMPGAQTYTFIDVIVNTQWGLVRIGADALETTANLVSAINRDDAWAGLRYSLPTWENSLVNADAPSGATFVVRNKSAGQGYIAALSSTGTAFAWSAPLTSGGITDFGTTVLQAAVEGTSNTAQVYYTPGNPVIGPIVPAVPAGYYLQVEYTRLGGDVIIVEDTALVLSRATLETGTGKYQQMLSDTSQTSAVAGLKSAQAALAAFKVLPVEFRHATYRPGLTPGQLLTITLLSPGHDIANPGHAPFLAGSVTLPQTWFVQSVDGEMIPVKPWMPGAGHYRYTIHVIDVAQIGDYLDFWEGLSGSGGGSGGGATLVGGTGSGAAGTSASGSGSAGIAVHTANYRATSADGNRLLSFQGAGPWTLTLPAPAASNAWQIAVQNASAAALTLDPDALLIDGVAGVVTLAAGAGLRVFSDGANYFTLR